MTEPLYVEDLKVGDQWTSRGRTVTEADVVNFATQTGDFDPLHVDHEFARNTPFRRPIAHGLMGICWVAGLGSTSPQINTLAFLSVSRWEFLKPIFIGDTLHVMNEIVGLEPSGRRRAQVTWKRLLINQNNDVVQSGLFETLVGCRPAAKVATSPATTVAPPHHASRAVMPPSAAAGD